MAGPYTTNAEVNYLGIGKQSVKTTGVAPTVFVPYVGDVNVDHGMSGTDVFEGGVGPYVSRSVKEKHAPGGGFSMAWRPKTGAQLIAWFLGQDAAVLNGSLYDHTASPAATPTWLSVEPNLNDEFIERFVDSVLSKVTIKGAEANGDLMVDMEWLGSTPAWQGSAASETYETGLHGSTVGAPYRGQDGAFTLDGSSATNIHSWELVLDWGIDPNVYTSQVTRAWLPKLQLTAELTVRVLELATTDYRSTNYGSGSGTAAAEDYFRTGSSAWTALYDNGLTSTNSRTLSIQCPAVSWKGAPRKIGSRGETIILERKGTVQKVSGSALVSVVSKTADSSAY